ncbi:MAG TPA: LacI family DNA-binding transcriptional regulator [Terriglobia bacterium]|nr:LacI family DNA-binding transcriptional regulator [Terriglobia bacterium]
MAGKLRVQELATRASVSVATVSRILNGSARVSQELQDRVRKAAAEIGINLQDTTRSRTVAFVLGNRHMLHMFHSRVLAGAQDYCTAHGWDAIFLSYNYQPSVPWKELRFPQVLRRRDIIRAAILGGTHSENLLIALGHRGIPFAALGNNLLLNETEHLDYDVVYSNDLQSAYELTRYLQSLNHRNIWFVGNTKLPWFARCYSGYNRAMKDAGLLPRLSEFYSQDEEEVGYLAAKSILGGGQAVTAIFAGTDPAARGVYRAAREAGKNIPNDLSVVACNDTYGALLSPPLTTIREFPELLGSQLVELVLSRIADPDLPPRQVTIPTEIIKRESCASLSTVAVHAVSKN